MIIEIFKQIYLSIIYLTVSEFSSMKIVPLFMTVSHRSLISFLFKFGFERKNSFLILKEICMINIFNTLIKIINRNKCLKEDGIYGNNYLI